MMIAPNSHTRKEEKKRGEVKGSMKELEIKRGMLTTGDGMVRPM